MLTGKNIIITGCLQGIGKETLKVFAENRANIFACAHMEDLKFISYCKNLEIENNINIYPIFFDMMDNLSIKEAAKQIISKKIDIHGLVNIAGINKDALFNMITYQDMLDTFQVNVFSQIIFTQYIVKFMQRKNTSGSVVFTSSVTALDGNEGQITYGASKAALNGAMKTMAIELGKSNIRVNTIAPGIIQSPMTDKLDENLIKEKTNKMNLPRIGSSEEVANLYMYLVSELSSHVSGQTFRVDGGI